MLQVITNILYLMAGAFVIGFGVAYLIKIICLLLDFSESRKKRKNDSNFKEQINTL